MGSAVGQSAPDVRAALILEGIGCYEHESRDTQRLCKNARVALDALVAENARLREALAFIPPDRLERLADWVDLVETEVQNDLRRMAAASRSTLEVPA